MVVIMMIVYILIELVIEVMKLGVYDYVFKFFDVEELKILVKKVFEKIEFFDENVYLC